MLLQKALRTLATLYSQFWRFWFRRKPPLYSTREHASMCRGKWDKPLGVQFFLMAGKLVLGLLLLFPLRACCLRAKSACGTVGLSALTRCARLSQARWLTDGHGISSCSHSSTLMVCFVLRDINRYRNLLGLEASFYVQKNVQDAWISRWQQEPLWSQ